MTKLTKVPANEQDELVPAYGGTTCHKKHGDESNKTPNE
eukprot:CAMPEP_0172519942 /NCGR_PEP_ID=MMETSP1066-20121228/291709_1 /TAXON_ID=671091 /ORGANISM="Coscinodiscus wailesii, Strain CCMP2513" /LENGTH=38 /DNA_ID= /DNA_START= /DNA_END= /DNA_ORIENTATION=